MPLGSSAAFYWPERGHVRVIHSAAEIESGEIVQAGVVIVGSGAAGIPLALELAERGLSVVLLESGSEKVDPQIQDLYAGAVADPATHPPADKYRQRCLGGTTGTWGGRCVPFDPIDLMARDYVADSGWPLQYEELAPYYVAANRWLEAGECEYSSEAAFPGTVGPLIEGFDPMRVSVDSLERFSRPTNLYRRYRSRLAASRSIRVIYGANCTAILLDPSGESVNRLEVSTIDGCRFVVRGDVFVLATGGLETARLLLNSDDVHKNGVGNNSDVVGRYYMCHIAGNVGILSINGALSRVRHGYEVSPEGIYCRRRISLTADEQIAGKANNVVLRLHFPRIADPAHRSGVLSLIYLLKPFISYEYATRLRDGDEDKLKSMLLHVRNVLFSPLETVRFLTMWTFRRILASRKFPSIILENKSNTFSLEVHGEHAPRRDSRVYLGEERDALGMRRVVIDWKYSRQDIESVATTLDVLASELEKQGAGTLRYDPDSLERELLRFGAYGGHHIGTARMGLDSRTSVVDANCKVHGIDNLFIAGSAVFPTSSQANPTLMITALAVRLADHLGRQAVSGQVSES